MSKRLTKKLTLIKNSSNTIAQTTIHCKTNIKLQNLEKNLQEFKKSYNFFS